MSDESDLAVSAGPETIVETTVAEKAPEQEGQTEGLAADPKPEEGEGAEKNETLNRREREKALKQRLRDEAAQATQRAAEAEARRLKIIEAGKSKEPPKESDFAEYSEFLAAQGVWAAQKGLAQARADDLGDEAQEAKRQAQQAEAQIAQAEQAAWAERSAEAKTRYADFEAVAYTAPISDEVAKMLLKSERGPDLAYHLGVNKALAVELSNLAAASPVEAAIQIGRLEASLSAPQPRTQTQAPQPITPVRGGAGAPLNPESLSMEDYVAARRAGKIR